MPQFLILLKPPRENFLETITEHEQSLATEHFYYYKELLNRKILFLAGRTDDAIMGIGIMTAENKTEVAKFVNADPAIMGKMFTATIKEFSIALLDNE